MKAASRVSRVACIAAIGLAAVPGGAMDRDWPIAGGDPGHRQYSPLSEINRANVGALRVAWTYRSGDADKQDRSQIQCSPIVVGRTLYATSPGLKVFALDAATGKERWVFDPFATGESPNALGVNRGVVYWRRGDDERILVTAGQRLYALSARTGRPIPTFGRGGSVSLLDGLDRDVRGLYVLSNSPGAIYGDLLILGTRVSEGPGASAPGHIRAYDVRSGALRWIFHTIPYPGETGAETWPKDAWTRLGGANAWTGISVDRKRGLVFLATGSAAFDFWGGNRHGANLFANCVLVLNAATGARVWHYQVVHHDLWDRDLPAPPILVRLMRGGRPLDAVARLTTSGHAFALDRANATPLFPLDEREAPQSEPERDNAEPTQPVPTKPQPVARQTLTEADLNGCTPASRADLVARLRAVRTGRPFTPPSEVRTVIFPGFDGGAEWGGAAFDERTGVLFVNANEMPWILTMLPIDQAKETTDTARGRRTYQQNCAACHGLDRRGVAQGQYPAIVGVASTQTRESVDRLISGGKGLMPSFGMLSASERSELVAYLFGDAPRESAGEDPPDVSVPYTHTGYNRFLDTEGYPAVKPPWGTLNAIDLNKGEIAWSKPLGELPELKQRGIPPTGTENYGGPIATAGGLVFIGATKDEKFRAFDGATGELVWETSLPAGGYATPATYSVDGRQYVVIAAGGGKMGTKSGDSYVAFALPR